MPLSTNLGDLQFSAVFSVGSHIAYGIVAVCMVLAVLLASFELWRAMRRLRLEEENIRLKRLQDSIEEHAAQPEEARAAAAAHRDVWAS